MFRYKQVDSIAAVEVDSLVLDWKRHLPLKFQLAKPQLITQALFMGGLQQPRPELAMYLDGSPDNFASEVSRNQLPPCLRASVLTVILCHRSKSSRAALASVFSSRYLMITGAYTATPHSGAFPRFNGREPGTTTAPSGTTSGWSGVAR